MARSGWNRMLGTGHSAAVPLDLLGRPDGGCIRVTAGFPQRTALPQ